MAKFGIALGSGPRGLGFESRHSDQRAGTGITWSCSFFCGTEESEASWVPSPSGFCGAESEWGHIASSSACTASGSNPDTPTTKRPQFSKLWSFSVAIALTNPENFVKIQQNYYYKECFYGKERQGHYETDRRQPN